MKKKNFKILILIIVVISTVFLMNRFFATKNQTIGESSATNIEIPQLSFETLWTPNGMVICTAENDQNYPQICSDGAGGAIITWVDDRSSELDIYTQRVNSIGDVQWTPNGTAICTADNDQENPQICSDGTGGAIITWDDQRSLSDGIYAQRVDSTGNIQWTLNGTAICTAPGFQSRPQICSDGAGGAIITWWDNRGGSNIIYTQKVNATGDVQWVINGIAISIEGYIELAPQICSDGAGGAIIAWEDLSSELDIDIYAQRVDSNGVVQWTSNGTAICTANNEQLYTQISADGAGGVIITWSDYRNNPSGDIYAQKVDSSGNVQWTTDGIAICTNIDQFLLKFVPQICSDGGGGAIISWNGYGMDMDIYAQRVDSTGNVQWKVDGIAICTADGRQVDHQICSDENGGAIITWRDYRYSISDIYAQKVSANGNTQWTSNGKPICTESNTQAYPQICRDGTGGAIITWEDLRSGADYDIYAQLIKDVPSKGGGAIPFGNYYLLFTLISIFSLIILKKCRNILTVKL